MPTFALLWFVAAVIGAVCILAGLEEVLFIQWVSACLYIVTLLCWRHSRIVQQDLAPSSDQGEWPQEQETVPMMPGGHEGTGDRDPLRSVTRDRRFPDGMPDELESRLMSKCTWMEQRMQRLQVSAA